MHTPSPSTQGPEEGLTSSHGSEALGSVTLAHANNIYSFTQAGLHQLLTHLFKDPFVPHWLIPHHLLSLPLFKAPCLLLLREGPALGAEHQSLYHKQGLGLCEERLCRQGLGLCEERLCRQGLGLCPVGYTHMHLWGLPFPHLLHSLLRASNGRET